MTRILALTRYSSLGASSRLRTLQHLPGLETLGIETTVRNLFDDAYLEDLYADRRTRWTRIAMGYARRMALRRVVNSYDAIWLEKEALPWLPSTFERFVLREQPFIVDYDDAIFHRYDQHPRGVVRRFLGEKIDRIMRSATAVTVGNDYIADRARRAGARRIEVIPTAVNIGHYPRCAGRSRDAPFTVGWIGTPQTARYLLTIADALRRFAATGNVRFVFIGCPSDLDLGVPYETRKWSESTEGADLASLDCGLMPLPDAPFERGKSGYKLIQYMACGLPVVASPIGVNAEIVTQGVNGYLATTEVQWLDALRHLKSDDVASANMGANGRRLVERSYSTEIVTPRIAALLQSLAATATLRER